MSKRVENTSGGGRAGSEPVLTGPTETERRLLHIWSEVLELDQETVEFGASFLALDGDSMQAVQIINRVAREWGIELSLDRVFDQSVREMAAAIDDYRRSRLASDAAAVGQEASSPANERPTRSATARAGDAS